LPELVKPRVRFGRIRSWWTAPVWGRGVRAVAMGGRHGRGTRADRHDKGCSLLQAQEFSDAVVRFVLDSQFQAREAWCAGLARSIAEPPTRCGQARRDTPQRCNPSLCSHRCRRRPGLSLHGQIESWLKHLESLPIILTRCDNSAKYGNKRVTRNSKPISPSAVLSRLIDKRFAHIKYNRFYHGSNLS
jgi:hypothetical protein